MRPEILYLTDMVEAADAIARFLAEIEKSTFLDDELRRSAVLQKLIVIGEAASRLSDEFRAQHPEIKWKGAMGLRNIGVHEYFGVNWEIVWDTVNQDIPIMREQIAAILAADYPDQDEAANSG